MTPQATDPPRRKQGRGRPRLIATALILAAVAVAMPPAQRPSPVTVRVRLFALAASITAVPDDTSAGYAYHHQRVWKLDTTGSPAPPGMREHTPAVFAADVVYAGQTRGRRSPATGSLRSVRRASAAGFSEHVGNRPT